ncbi:hypothetical protein [Tateyamaria sp. SN3-11]|uniref:hypothetical protein n=1 Tax=Tateyamaria sp. SN3-11 TaxID=3092147 RepID=UPI0039EC8A7C
MIGKLVYWLGMLRRLRWRQRAQGGHCLFSLRPRAAQKMQHERKQSCRRAARKMALGAARSLNQVSKLQVAGQGHHWTLTVTQTASLRKCSAFIAALQPALAIWVF